MSEFERAVFRVYENTIDGFNFDGVQTNISTKIFKLMEVLFRMMAIFSFFGLIFLHVRFVGDHKLNCLPNVLADQQEMFWQADTGFENSSITSDTSGTRRVFFNFSDDYILHLDVYRPQDEIQNMEAVKVNGTNDYQLKKKKPDFEYATTGAVLSLTSELQKKFIIVNITLPLRECFGEFPVVGGGSAYGLVVFFDGVDTVLMNDLMFASRKPGVLVKYTGDRSRWSAVDLDDSEKRDHDNNSVMSMLLAANSLGWAKMGILMKSALAFLLLSASTAILIRILLSSGVILLYPFLYLLEFAFSRGVSMRTAYRLMTLAYPWLGLPMEVLRSRRMSAAPFLIGHVTQIFVYYVMYEGVQILTSMWIYNHSMPDVLDVWLYFLVMLAEYYSIVYTRSVAGVRFFPRCFAAFFLLYHIYLFAFPAGFHTAAMMSFSAATSSLVLFSLRKLEYPAYMRGDISIDRPRGLFNSLPYSHNGIFLPPEFTTFMPLNRRARGVYDNVAAPGRGGGGGGGPNDDDDDGDGDDNYSLLDLELGMGGGISATETPLLHHHHLHSQGLVDPGGSVGFHSLAPAPVAPSGRRRRRRRHGELVEDREEERGSGRGRRRDRRADRSRGSPSSSHGPSSEEDESKEDDYGASSSGNSRPRSRISRGAEAQGQLHGNYQSLASTEFTFLLHPPAPPPPPAAPAASSSAASSAAGGQDIALHVEMRNRSFQNE